MLRDKLVPADSYQYEDSYPTGTQAIRTIEISSRSIFAVDEEHTEGIPVYKNPDTSSKELFLLGPLEAVPILEVLDWHYKVLLPGSTEGFVQRNLGVKRDWAPKVESHFGYYGVKKEKAKVGGVRYVPDIHSETMLDLNTFFRIPIVEEWDNWFKVQLPDGSLGFVPEEYGTRTIAAETLVDKPSEGSGNALGGLLKVTGLLVLGTVGAALQESMREDY